VCTQHRKAKLHYNKQSHKTFLEKKNRDQDVFCNIFYEAWVISFLNKLAAESCKRHLPHLWQVIGMRANSLKLYRTYFWSLFLDTLYNAATAGYFASLKSTSTRQPVIFSQGSMSIKVATAWTLMDCWAVSMRHLSFLVWKPKAEANNVTILLQMLYMHSPANKRYKQAILSLLNIYK